MQEPGPKHGSARQRLPRGSENILIIDDEVSVCEIAKDMLSNLGYGVSFVHDGKAGVEMYRTRRASIDLIMMNMNMPLMGGRETFRQLKNINPDLPVLIVTGHGRAVLDESNGRPRSVAICKNRFNWKILPLKSDTCSIAESRLYLPLD